MVTPIHLSERRQRTPVVRCFTRATWAEDWEPAPNLQCDSVAFTANPDMATAHFTWRYGRLLVAGQDAFIELPRWEPLRVFVRVEITLREAAGELPQPIVWIGILEQDNGQQKGLLAAPAGAATRAGAQKLVAYGLDLLLARHVLLASTVDNGDGVEESIARAIDFNPRTHATRGGDHYEPGNRSADLGAEGAYLFAGHSEEAWHWTSLEIVFYLLAYQPPRNQVDESAIRWYLDAEAYLAGVLPDFDEPRLAQHGRSMRQVLDELVDRRRLLGYTVSVNDGDNSILLTPFTFAPTEITYEGHKIPANADQVALVFDSDTGVQHALVRRGTLESIDQVVCQGARAVACFTLHAGGDVVTPTGTLVPGWTLEQQTAYTAAASDTPGYNVLDISEQQHRNELVRSLDRYERVYSYFGLDVNWQGHVGRPGDGIAYYPRGGDDPQPLHAYLPGLRFRNHLPLRAHYDYSGQRIEQGTVLNHTPPGEKWEYLPPLVGIQIPGASEPERWQLVHRLSTSIEALFAPSLGLADGLPWSASVRMQDDWPGIVVTVSGQPQHALARHDHAPLPVDENAGEFAWQTMWATVAMDVDQYAEGRWPETPADEASVRRMIVDVGDRYQVHYVARGTIVGLEADGSWQSTEGGYVRDDRPRLTALARLIYEWYSTERQSLELELGYVTDQLRVGQLITTIGQGPTLQTVNSVITQISYEFQELEASGQSVPEARTKIVTQFAELDARRFLGRD